MLSMTTDFARPDGCPRPYLERIAEAGFTHVHWCQQWCTDFLYFDNEIAQIKSWMGKLGLGLTDLHGSSGKEKCWTSAREYEREAGVALVWNRLKMAAELGGDVVIMHVPREPEADREKELYWSRLRRSLDALEPFAVECGVRIAIENGEFEVIEKILAQYDPAYLGLCYDCGHGNLRPDGLDRLEGLKDRLISLHLHDNDGTRDQHRIPFTGSVDWPRLAGIIATSSYAKWVNLECTMSQSEIEDEAEFLAGSFEAAGRVAGLIEAARPGSDA